MSGIYQYINISLILLYHKICIKVKLLMLSLVARYQFSPIINTHILLLPVHLYGRPYPGGHG